MTGTAPKFDEYTQEKKPSLNPVGLNEVKTTRFSGQMGDKRSSVGPGESPMANILIKLKVSFKWDKSPIHTGIEHEIRGGEIVYYPDFLINDFRFLDGKKAGIIRVNGAVHQKGRRPARDAEQRRILESIGYWVAEASGLPCGGCALT